MKISAIMIKVTNVIKKIMDKRNYIIFGIIVILIIGLIVINNNKVKEYVKSYNYFSETLTIKLYSQNNLQKNLDDINNIYKKYDNYYRDLTNLDNELTKLLEYGKSLYNKSNGLIDITNNELIDCAVKDKQCNYKSTINELNLKDKKSLKNLNIDSIIGSYATKEVEKYLKKNKINKYIINENGNIVTGESYNEKYKVSINNQDSKVIDIAYLKNISMATKGNTNTFQSYMVNSKTQTKNGENKIVVVIAKDINEANFLANTLYHLSIDEGKEFIHKHDAEVMWYTNSKKVTTEGFKKYLKVD